jgi:hypothetical protein
MARYTLMLQRHRQQFNLPAAEWEALKQLRAMHGIIIKPADKNLGLVIMLESDYRACVQAIVSDTTVYTKITPAIAQHVTAARDKL